MLCFSNQKIKKHNWYHPLLFHKVWSNLMLKFHSQNVGVFSLSLYFVIQWKAIEQMIFIFLRRQMFCYWLCRKLIDGCRSADDMMHIWKPALWFLILHLFTCDSLFSITTVKHFLVIWGKKPWYIQEYTIKKLRYLLIIMTCLLDNVWILLGKVECDSFLRVKGFKNMKGKFTL